MKINEVERLAGITKVNIRFYEREGLLTPSRNSENGYRDYGEEDVLWLKKIRLLRMLDVPIEEILRLKQGELTLEEAMGRHKLLLERRQTNLGAMQDVCEELRLSHCQLDTLDADEVLERMARQEQEGTRFMNVTRRDKITRYAAPVAAALVILLLIGGLAALAIWAVLSSPEEMPPVGIMIAATVLIVVIIAGLLLALFQRLRQIKGGEEDAASQY